jgi:hypothetical protein
MSPREIIARWLPRTFRHVDPGENTWDEIADDLLKALDEQGMAVVPKDYPLDSDVLLAGARSIGKSMHIDNHMERARLCWIAMMPK